MPSNDLLPSEQPVQLLDQTGSRVAGAAGDFPSDDAMLRAHEALVVGRRINEQAYALVRQGRLAVYPSSYGQEACEVAAALVLGDQDWLFPTYRDVVSIVGRGVDPVETLTLLKGDWHCGYDPTEHRVAPQTTPLATQLIHAVGVAHAATLRGEDTVVMAMCGDGATSEGDFHEALNFAAVFKAPVVFFVQNNEYAISVPAGPAERGTVAGAQGHRLRHAGGAGRRQRHRRAAVGAGRRGRRPRAAVAGRSSSRRTPTGCRPTPTPTTRPATARTTRSRAWQDRDPLLRSEAYLRSRDLLTDERTSEIAAAAEAVAAAMRDGLMQDVEPDPADLFAHVYATPTPQLREQRRSSPTS